MKVSTESIENSQVALSVEMETAEVDEYIDKAYYRLVKKVSVPGFRKGKTPKTVLERHIGKEVLFQEALEQLIPEVYAEALEQQAIDAIDQPKIELLQAEPLTFKAIVPVRPTVKLGDYKSVRIEPELVEVDEKDIDSAIEQLREQNAVLLPAERAAQFGDVLTIDVEDRKDNVYVPLGKGLVYELKRDARLPLPGFAEKLEGLKKDEETNFALSYPADYEDTVLAGKEHFFKVKVIEIKEKQLPELNDEFAKGLGTESLALLRERIAADLKFRNEERSRLQLEQKALDAVIELSNLEYPPILVERAIDWLVREEAREFPEGVDGLMNYLNSLGKTIDGHREELRSLATQRVIRSLVMREIAGSENIEVADSELDNEVEKMLKDAGEQAEGMRKFFDLPEARASIKDSLVNKKTMERLVAIATGSE